MVEDHQHEDHQHGEHHGGIGKYLVVLVALCVLTTCSFLTYFEFWDRNFSDATGWAFMMAVSCTKALLVILFFMHLMWEANWKYVLTFPAALMSLFLVLMLVPDIGLRTRRYSEQRWLHAADREADHKLTEVHGQTEVHGHDKEHHE